ncbi:hypothetical protein [Flavobacterium laiguense]|uniref:hypothetical protein n=1 Tax=Flavobacterium laiguense TaxID=2169409 RepID=UPI0016704EC5|nr:hypothetical protein [Flavobacterium laiguense]
MLNPAGKSGSESFQNRRAGTKTEKQTLYGVAFPFFDCKYSVCVYGPEASL